MDEQERVFILDFAQRRNANNLWADGSNWDDEDMPDQQWAVPSRIPLRQVVLFTGEGAAGKSTMALHLCASTVLGRDWLGALPAAGPAFFIDAEDHLDVIRRRLGAVINHYGCMFRDLWHGGFHIASLLGRETLFATGNRNGAIEPTKLYDVVLKEAEKIQPKIIAIASSANVYSGSEIDRSQVQQFVNLLSALAAASNGAVVLIAHPSVTGSQDGRGYSGSTQWHNAVRARMYLHALKPKDDEQPDSDVRQLEFMKNQYGPVSNTITLRYQAGMFLPEKSPSTLEKLAREDTVKDLLLRLLRQAAADGVNLSANPTANNYLPSRLAKTAEAKDAKIRKPDFETAMRAMLDAGKLKTEDYGKFGYRRVVAA